MIAYFETETAEGRGGFWEKRRLELELRPLGRISYLHAVLPLPDGMQGRKRRKRVEWAMAQLKKRGVHRLATKKAWREAALEQGIPTIEEGIAWRQGAGQGALFALQSRGIPLEQAFCRLEAARCDRDVVRCARMLAEKVRYLSVRIGAGQRELEEALYEGFGIAPQQSAPPEYPCLRICFPSPAAEEWSPEVLRLAPGGWPGLCFAPPPQLAEQQPAGMEDTLYSAMLLESGLCQPEELLARSEVGEEH